MTKGKTYYVDHVEANIPWTTKETPHNVRTKGALKFKNALLRLNNGNASIDHLTEENAERLEASQPTRIIFYYKNEFLWLLKHNGIKHKTCKHFSGRCGSNLYVVELSREDLTMLALVYPNQFRLLTEDEPYYQMYEDPNMGKKVYLSPNYQGKIEKDLSNFEDHYEE
jgi:hypothetical protein